MFRKLAATAVGFAIAGGASAAMMSSPMMTTSYFPMVDGARYDYAFTMGPRVSATIVMHNGQTWAGAQQLTSAHMMATCLVAGTCVEDETSFYRMDPDGMRYFGGDSQTADGTHYSMMFTTPDWMLKNPVTPGTMMAGGMGYQNPDTWQSTSIGMNTMMGPQSLMNMYYAEAIETVSTPAGTFDNTLHMRQQRADGSVRDVWYAPGVGMVRWMDGKEEALLAKITMPTGPVPPVGRAVEYYHARLDHYFMTSDPTEIGLLDSGHFEGWQRTGMGFNVVAAGSSAAGALPVCRYYGSPAYGIDSHFYSASADECAAVHRNWPMQWTLESNDVFEMFMPNANTGACPAGTLPIYRTWNARVDSNHRYTMDPKVSMGMMARGSIPEGYGTPAVAMCSPQ